MAMSRAKSSTKTGRPAARPLAARTLPASGCAPASASAPNCCPAPTAPVQATPAHVAALKALAHLGRLRVFFHLVHAGRPLPANEIQTALGLPGPTLSHHLEQLEKVGLIARVRHERFILSSVRRELVVDLVRLLTACC